MPPPPLSEICNCSCSSPRSRSFCNASARPTKRTPVSSPPPPLSTRGSGSLTFALRTVPGMSYGRSCDNDPSTPPPPRLNEVGNRSSSIRRNQSCSASARPTKRSRVSSPPLSLCTRGCSPLTSVRGPSYMFHGSNSSSSTSRQSGRASQGRDGSRKRRSLEQENDENVYPYGHMKKSKISSTH